MSELTKMNVLQYSPRELFTLLNKQFSNTNLGGGEEWLAWEPETVLLQLPQISNPVSKDKILAVHTACFNTSAVVTEWLAFEKVVSAFCNNPCIADVIQVPHIEEMYYTLGQLEELIAEVHPNESGREREIERQLSNQICGFIAAVAFNDGWLVLPAKFGVTTQESLNKLNGIYVGNEKYTTVQPIIDKVLTTAKQLCTPTFSNNDLTLELSRLESVDTYEFSHIRRIIGCYLYDPMNVDG